MDQIVVDAMFPGKAQNPVGELGDVLDQIRSASDRARRETAERPEWAGRDGGDIKVAITLKKK